MSRERWRTFVEIGLLSQLGLVIVLPPLGMAIAGTAIDRAFGTRIVGPLFLIIGFLAGLLAGLRLVLGRPKQKGGGTRESKRT